MSNINELCPDCFVMMREMLYKDISPEIKSLLPTLKPNTQFLVCPRCKKHSYIDELDDILINNNSEEEEELPMIFLTPCEICGSEEIEIVENDKIIKELKRGLEKAVKAVNGKVAFCRSCKNYSVVSNTQSFL